MPNSITITDFGLSTKMKHSKIYLQCGSPGYIAPEVLNEQGYGIKADIFSLGIVVYQMLTGKFIFEPDSTENVQMKN